MRSVIIDSNIVFSLLLSNKTHLKSILFDPEIAFYAPNHLFIEIFRLKEKIVKYTKLSGEEF